MNFAFAKTKTGLAFTEILYLVFFIGLVCAFRAVTSICIGTMVLTGIILYKNDLKFIFGNKLLALFTISCCVFFFLQIISLSFTTNLAEGLNDARLKSGLVFTPFAVLFLFAGNRYESGKLYSWYCLLIFFASVYLLYTAAGEFMKNRNISVFFYHALVRPFRYHAVYYSILVFIALLFVVENLAKRNYFLNKYFHLFLLLFLSGFLLLLASKLVISFYSLFCFYFLFTQHGLFNKSRLIIYTLAGLLVVGTTFILITKNPISIRFNDFVNGNISLIRQDKFSPSVYFNGLQFRLLEWKLVPQILKERHAWWTGVSTGDAQTILDNKYLELNMYRGEPGKPGGGYLGYNVHNQLLQSLLQSGIPGAISFLFICTTLILLAIRSRKRIVRFTITLLLCYLFVESLFEEQYGIVIFCFWPIFLARSCKEDSVSMSTINKTL